MLRAHRIAQKRKELGLSQEGLGEQLGVSRQAIYKWESDASLPEIDKLITLSKIFSVSVGWLLGVEEAPSPAEPPSGELTEAQLQMVQEIVDRYLAAQPKQAPLKRRKLVGLCGAAAVLALVVALFNLFSKLDRVTQDYNNLRYSVDNVSNNVNSQIGSITNRVEDILKSQNALTAEQSARVVSTDYRANTVTIEARVMPRTYVEGMTAEFILVSGGESFTVPGERGENHAFTAQITGQLSDEITVSAALLTGDQRQTQVLEEFGELIDPKTGNPLMDRTALIANTSNMPVAAREASIYTGLTLAEYYRDMGYDVAIMADSTSRWAEALRELSGRLEEMPAEEGFPAYLASRLSAFYERAGLMLNLNGTEGSVSIIGAVSPQGGDFSEPVTQNTKRFVRCFWGLDKSLAYARHFPAIHWLTSYSEYTSDLAPWYKDHVSKDFMDCRNRIMVLLNQECSLMEIVKLIGSDVLPDDQKLVLEIARVIRLGFLQQNAFHPDDTCVPMEKQMKMMQIILYLYDKASADCS